MPLSDRVDTVHHQQPAANRCTVHFGKCCFCAVEGTVGGLCFWHHVITVEVGLKSTLHYPLQQLREERQCRNRPVVLLRQRADDCLLELCWKAASSQRLVTQQRDER